MQNLLEILSQIPDPEIPVINIVELEKTKPKWSVPEERYLKKIVILKAHKFHGFTQMNF